MTLDLENSQGIRTHLEPVVTPWKTVIICPSGLMKALSVNTTVMLNQFYFGAPHPTFLSFVANFEGRFKHKKTENAHAQRIFTPRFNILT